MILEIRCTFWKKNAMIMDVFKIVPNSIATKKVFLMVVSASGFNLKILLDLMEHPRLVFTFCS